MLIAHAAYMDASVGSAAADTGAPQAVEVTETPNDVEVVEEEEDVQWVLQLEANSEDLELSDEDSRAEHVGGEVALSDIVGARRCSSQASHVSQVSQPSDDQVYQSNNHRTDVRMCPVAKKLLNDDKDLERKNTDETPSAYDYSSDECLLTDPAPYQRNSVASGQSAPPRVEHDKVNTQQRHIEPAGKDSYSFWLLFYQFSFVRFCCWSVKEAA